jgi:hypothetical protein
MPHPADGRCTAAAAVQRRDSFAAAPARPAGGLTCRNGAAGSFVDLQIALQNCCPPLDCNVPGQLSISASFIQSACSSAALQKVTHAPL